MRPYEQIPPNRRWEICAQIAAARLIAVVREASAQNALAVAEAIVDAGIDIVEITLTTPDAFNAIRSLAESRPSALLGAGSVLDASSARMAILAGARFLVAPSLALKVLRMGHRYGAAVMLGAQTPSETVQALAAGADLVKLFPAASLGTAHLRAILTAFPQAPIVPTGGVNAVNAAEWLRAGAIAVGLGNDLSARGLMGIPERVHQAKAAIAQSNEEI